MLGLRELLAIVEHLDHRVHLENLAHPVTLDRKVHLAITALRGLLENPATMERKEPLVTTAHPVCLEDPVYQEKTVTMVLPDLRDPKAKLARQVTLFRRKSPDLPVHPATQVKTENQVTMAAPVPLAHLALLDLKDRPANQAPMGILVGQDLKETLETQATTEHPARTDIPARQAKFQDLLGHLDLLDHLATMVLLAKTVFPAEQVHLAKMDSPALLDILV